MKKDIKRVIPDAILGPEVLPAEPQEDEKYQRSQELLSQLEQATSPKQTATIIEELIELNDESSLVNAISKVSDYPNGVTRLVEAIVEKQSREGRVAALVWMLENSDAVIRMPRTLYTVVKAVIESGNEKAIQKIAAIKSVNTVPILRAAIETRSTFSLNAALERFNAHRK